MNASVVTTTIPSLAPSLLAANRLCPGGSIGTCTALCPFDATNDTAEVFRACVKTCAARCGSLTVAPTFAVNASMNVTVASRIDGATEPPLLHLEAKNPPTDRSNGSSCNYFHEADRARCTLMVASGQCKPKAVHPGSEFLWELLWLILPIITSGGSAVLYVFLGYARSCKYLDAEPSAAEKLPETHGRGLFDAFVEAQTARRGDI